MSKRNLPNTYMESTASETTIDDDLFNNSTNVPILYKLDLIENVITLND